MARKITRSSGTTVESILMQAENVLIASRELRPHGPQVCRLLQVRARLSQSMTSKLEAIRRHAGLMRLRAARLPPSVSSLYILTRKTWHQFLRAMEADLRDMSRSEISRLFASPARPHMRRKLMTISTSCDVEDATRLRVIADIRVALGRIAEDHGIDLGLSPPGEATRRLRLPQSAQRHPAAVGQA